MWQESHVVLESSADTPTMWSSAPSAVMPQGVDTISMGYLPDTVTPLATSLSRPLRWSLMTILLQKYDEKHMEKDGCLEVDRNEKTNVMLKKTKKLALRFSVK